MALLRNLALDPAHLVHIIIQRRVPHQPGDVTEPHLHKNNFRYAAANIFILPIANYIQRKKIHMA